MSVERVETPGSNRSAMPVLKPPTSVSGALLLLLASAFYPALFAGEVAEKGSGLSLSPVELERLEEALEPPVLEAGVEGGQLRLRRAERALRIPVRPDTAGKLAEAVQFD